MVTGMADEEKIWTKHITKGSLGFSYQAIDLLVEHKANSVCRNLHLPLPYAITDGGPLMAIHDNYSMLSKSKTKSNFFEVPVGDYAIGGLDEDY
jgi:ribonucleotide reductase beta subunit family protein with ferritin-like domain